MNIQEERSLLLAAAGYPSKKRRKARIKLDLDNPVIYEKMKRIYIKGILDSVGGHRAKAAEIIGIHERTLYKWLQKLGM